MPIKTQWDDETQTMVRHDFSDPWTWEEYAVALAEARQHITNNSGRVAVLFNFSGVLHFPAQPLENLRRVLGPSPMTNWLASIVIGSGPEINALLRLLVAALPQWAGRTHVVDSLPAARALVAQLQAEQTDRPEEQA